MPHTETQNAFIWLTLAWQQAACIIAKSLLHFVIILLLYSCHNGQFLSCSAKQKTFGLRLGSIQRDYIDWIGMQTSGPNLLMFSSAEGWWQAERATSERTASSATHYHRPQSASVWHQCQRNGLSSRHTGASALTATIHWYSHKTRRVYWQATFFFSESRSRTVRVNWNWFIWLVVYWDLFQPNCTPLQRVLKLKPISQNIQTQRHLKPTIWHVHCTAHEITSNLLKSCNQQKTHLIYTMKYMKYIIISYLKTFCRHFTSGWWPHKTMFSHQALILPSARHNLCL